MELLQKCSDQFLLFAKRKGITIRIDSLSQELPYIFADRDMMGLVFDNLISNAVQYSHPGTDVNIAIRYSSEEHRFRVIINNVGVGIPTDKKNRIFLGFSRSNIQDPRRPIPGTGMGLMVARKIVTDHGGTIEVSSKKEMQEYNSWELENPRDWEGFNNSFVVTLDTRPSAR